MELDTPIPPRGERGIELVVCIWLVGAEAVEVNIELCLPIMGGCGA
jgi:hypothetical protein